MGNRVMKISKQRKDKAGKKSMHLWEAVSIGIGGMIGAGIFSILGVAIQISGNAVYLAFIMAGIVALFSTYSYAKLGARYPSAGGPVEFLIKGFGDNIISGGFNILLWIGYVFALALYARAFASYAMTFFPNAHHIYLNVFATGIILLFTAVNFIGSKAVGESELFIVTIKVGILILFSLIGFFSITPSLLSPEHWPSVNNVLFAAAVVFLAYEGFGLITNAAEDMEDPKKTLPRALFLSVVVTIMIYVGVSLTVVGNLPISEIVKARDYALAEAAKPFLGMVGFKIITIAALFSTSSAINATLYGAANVSYIIAKDGELPKGFDRKVWGRAMEGLFITAGLVLIFANFLDLEGISMLGSSAFLLIYAAVNFAHLRIYTETNASPYVIWISIIGCLASFGVLAYYEIKHSPLTLVVLVLVLGGSFMSEWIYRKKTSRTLKSKTFP
ncbi:APC family permease [Thermococcus stetteri]|uniref:APC family permease n=1 Tax=Thermococcus stetteri TaxID=49900 RepID=UPI001AE3E7A4|nr:APC family permease [Thermococcus stetteri]MBP1912995.1 amino acid transporter [Thermococcus stetteri]